MIVNHLKLKTFTLRPLLSICTERGHLFRTKSWMRYRSYFDVTVVPPPTRLDKCTREMIGRVISIHYDIKNLGEV